MSISLDEHVCREVTRRWSETMTPRGLICRPGSHFKPCAKPEACVFHQCKCEMARRAAPSESSDRG